MRKKIAVFFTAFVLLLCACAKKAYSPDAVAYEPMSAAQSQSEAFMMDANSPAAKRAAGGEAFENSAAGNVSRKLVTNSSVDLKIDDVGAAVEKLEALMAKYDAYASSINIYENSRTYVLKIPAATHEQFKNDVMKIGKVNQYSESTEDETIRFYDLESRLQTKQLLLKTYQEYLQKAKTIDEILAVEAQISQLQYEIDSTGTQFARLNFLIEYATMRLGMAGPQSESFGRVTLGGRIQDLFANYSGFVSTVLVALVSLVIFGIPVLALVFALYWLLLGKIGLLKKLWKLAGGKGKK